MDAFAYPLTGLVTILTVLVYFWTLLKVGSGRRTHQIAAPTMTGPDAFNRIIRVQANTLEALPLFLPALWLVALSWQDLWAAAIGVFFPIGRFLYAQGYYAAAEKRGTGFVIGMLSSFILILIALVQLTRLALAAYL